MEFVVKEFDAFVGFLEDFENVEIVLDMGSSSLSTVSCYEEEMPDWHTENCQKEDEGHKEINPF